MILIDEAIKYKKIPKETENIIKNKPSYQEYKTKILSLLSSYQDWLQNPTISYGRYYLIDIRILRFI